MAQLVEQRIRNAWVPGKIKTKMEVAMHFHLRFYFRQSSESSQSSFRLCLMASIFSAAAAEQRS